MTIKQLLVSSLLAISASHAVAEVTPLNKTEITEVTASVAKLMQDNYVFPNQGEQMAKLLLNNVQSGAYDKFKQPRKFSEQLTEDLRSINQDLHIRVIFDPERVKVQREKDQAPEDKTLPEQYLTQMARANFGFKEVKILDGNIGYINLTGFYDTQYAGDTAVAAMNVVANSDAIIFDLRANGGGSPSMIQLFTSYLYDSEPVHLNNFYWRPDDLNTQTWTLPHVYGKRNPQADVYVLTSKGTFSAAEEFTYNLKNLERATIIGETTGGGAHPGGTSVASDRFLVWIPSGRAINPITETNWEGTGVSPDIQVKQQDALNVAHVKALENLIAKHQDDNDNYQWHLDGVKALQSPIKIAANTLQTYAGTYGRYILTFENGALYYQDEDQEKLKLTPINDQTFVLPKYSYFRVRIVKENDKVVALEGLYDNGHVIKEQKSS